MFPSQNHQSSRSEILEIKRKKDVKISLLMVVKSLLLHHNFLPLAELEAIIVVTFWEFGLSSFDTM